VASSDDNYIYAATETRIWCSSDGGETWQQISNGLPSHGNQNVWSLTFYNIAVSNTAPKTLWVGYANFYQQNKVFVSHDAGQTWENVTRNLPNLPVNSLACDPGTNDGIYVGMDAGVFYMDNSMDEWIDFSDGLPNVPVTELEVRQSSEELYAGTYGRSLWKTNTFNHGLAPVADFDYEILDSCTGEVQFTNNSTGYLDQVQWDFGDGTISDEMNPVHQFPGGGIYAVSLTVSNAYGTSEEIEQLTLMIPEAGFTATVSQDTASFQNQSVFAMAYLWDFGDGTTGTEKNPVHQYPGAGTYEVQLKAISGSCLDSVSQQVKISVGLEDPVVAGSLIVYPNPNSGSFRMEFTTTGNGEVLLQLCDMHGREVYSGTVHAPGGRFVKEINTGIASYGIFTLKITMDSQTLTQKVVIYNRF